MDTTVDTLETLFQQLGLISLPQSTATISKHHLADGTPLESATLGCIGQEQLIHQTIAQ